MLKMSLHGSQVITQTLFLLALMIFSITGCATGAGATSRYDPTFISGNQIVYQYDADSFREISGDAIRRCSQAGKRAELQGSPNCSAPRQGNIFTFQDCIATFICK